MERLRELNLLKLFDIHSSALDLLKRNHTRTMTPVYLISHSTKTKKEKITAYRIAQYIMDKLEATY
jgi:hypothetical protein